MYVYRSCNGFYVRDKLEIDCVHSWFMYLTHFINFISNDKLS